MSSSALRSGLENTELSQRATLARLITLGSTQAGHVPHQQMILECIVVAEFEKFMICFPML
jgi:hypothetical protein